MCRLLLSTYSDGPTMVLSPPYLHNTESGYTSNPASIAPDRPQFPNPSPASNHVYGTQSGPPKSLIGRSGFSMSGSSSTPLIANPSRKRSRDEFNTSSDEDTNRTPSSQHSPASDPTGNELIYGEGMVLLNARTGLFISAESQTGTWLEEKFEAEAATATPIAVASSSGRPDLPSRKSQRLDPSASAGWDDITAAAAQRKLQSSAQDDTHRNGNSLTSTVGSTTLGPQNPLIDDATHLLGISWQRVNTDDPDVAAAVRGWEKFINNHFSQYLENAQIVLKHRGLNAYLVTARPPHSHPMDRNHTSMNGFSHDTEQPYFYLFKDDLGEGQLVGKSWETCLRNLRSTPIAFEAGADVMRATEGTPERLVEDQGIPNGATYVNGNGIKMGNEGMEMAMDIDR
ncbi:hypothetical protein PRK78_000389 [Emydomyces testavorans]|uniref:Uncharacterized protein n=1 Tax=Emydomyces testavorans TaxID=2070801 RepID=A0AAF0DAL5_9EURO|nr:hypothetical protein PRK78_000389 [Emydomyces testavorans]